MPSSSLKFIGFLLSVTLLIWETISNCITTNSGNTNDCNLCKYDFYKRSPYNITSSSTFLVSECLPKEVVVTKTLTYYVSGSGCLTTAIDCVGSISNPFGSLALAMVVASKESDKYTKVNVNILLIGDVSYILEEDMKLDVGLYLFRRLDGVVTVGPSDQTKTHTIFLKSSNFFIFVGSAVVFTGVNFDGIDLNAKSDNCLKQRSVCCTQSNLGVSQECSNFSQSGLDIIDDNTLGLFNVEYIVDIPSKIVPSLSLVNCQFRNIYALRALRGWRTLVNFEKSMPGQLIITNSSFSNCFFQKGIITRVPVTPISFYQLLGKFTLFLALLKIVYKIIRDKINLYIYICYITEKKDV